MLSQNCLYLFSFMNDNMNNLPKDPMMLMSVINMKLRDFYPSIEDLCDDMDIDRHDLDSILNKAGFEYSRDNNRYMQTYDNQV